MLKTLTFFGLILILSALIVGFFGNYVWWADLFSHWIPYYIIGAFLAGGAGYLIGWRLHFLICVVILFIALFRFIQVFNIPWTSYNEQENGIRVYYQNTQYTNEDIHHIEESIEDGEPDIIGLVEVRNELLTALEAKGYDIILRSGEGFNAIAWLVRGDIGIEIDTSMHEVAGYPLGELLIDEHQLLLIHPFPAWNEEDWRKQKEVFSFSRAFLDNPTSSFIIGDFNSSPYSPIFQSFFSSYTTPIYYTWSGYLNTLHLPIDHIIWNKGALTLHHLTRNSSDHGPIMFTLPRAVVDKE